MQDPTGCQIPLTGVDTVFAVGANAKFGSDDSLFCDFGTVNFSDSTTYNDPVISYSWTFGDGGFLPTESFPPLFKPRVIHGPHDCEYTSGAVIRQQNKPGSCCTRH